MTQTKSNIDTVIILASQVIAGSHPNGLQDDLLYAAVTARRVDVLMEWQQFAKATRAARCAD